MCSQIAVAIAVDGLPTHAATDLFNLSQLNRSSLIVTMSDLASDDQIAHQISENSDQQQPQQRPASCGGGCGCWSPYTGNLVDVAVGNCGCDWRSLSWMGPFRSLEKERWKRNNRRAGRNIWQSILQKKAIDWSFNSTQAFTSKGRFMQPHNRAQDRTKECENWQF